MSKPKRKTMPTHYTGGGTRKYQANGDVAWSEVFQEIGRLCAERDGGAPTEGRGIRAALAFAVRNKALIVDAVAISDGRVRAVDFVGEGHGVDLKRKPKAARKAARKPKAAK